MNNATQQPRKHKYSYSAHFKKTVIALACVLVVAPCLVACNIPVFRYALERWRPDTLELIVFHEGELSEAAREQLRALVPVPMKQFAQSDSANSNEPENAAAQSIGREFGTAQRSASNLEIVPVEVRAGAVSEAYAALWKQLRSEAIESGALESGKLLHPYATLRGKHPRGPFSVWSGPLANAANVGILDSPARKLLADRLLAGHAIVWVVIRSSDEARNAKLEELLAESAKSLNKSVELPEGIGLPGSELFSDVPLLLRFSTLVIERNAANETFLLSLAEGFQPEAFADDQPLVIPVFGRGRALEVIPASEISASLVEDLTLFLCGACSCQVKDQNPGFDLLFNCNWEQELYGADGERPPAATSISPEQKSSPVLLSIPPGRK